jgi:ankyrin repeat protein
MQLGLDVNTPDGSGSTPLHIAAQTNQLPSVLKLLDLGAKKDAQNGDGKTPLELGPKYNKQLIASLSN